MKGCTLCYRTEKTHRISVETQLCNPCEVAINYWRQKTPTRMIRRSQQIESFQNRMEFLMGNVKRIPRKRRKTG